VGAPIAAEARSPAWPSLPDLGRAAGALRRALKLYLRGERDRARRLVVDGCVLLRTPPPSLPTLRQALDLLGPPRQDHPRLASTADVIVPIHNGPEHLSRLLDTLFDRTDPRHRILLADDGSTDPGIEPLLAAASRRWNVRLFRSPANLGFVATVNAAMAMTEGDAVILNSDTEVPPGWIDRLLLPIEKCRTVASTTPFSNAAQIFSVPTPDQDHALPTGVGLVEIDRAFARLRPGPVDHLSAPTAIGFCMGISRRGWNALGPFDAGAFGRGYCEETDWSLRARAAGWSNLLVPDLFVFHAQGGSFKDAERKALMERNLATLHRRWPEYHGELARFRRRDPWSGYRAAALVALAADPPDLNGSKPQCKGRQRTTVVEVCRDNWCARVRTEAADGISARNGSA